jgi:hypothetical protein
MDFVEWCERVLRKLIQVRSSPEATAQGVVYEARLANALYGEGAAGRPEYWQSTHRRGLLSALDVLESFGLITKKKMGQMYQLDVETEGRKIGGDMSALWEGIFAASPRPESEQLLQLVNRLSQKTAVDHCWLERVPAEQFTEQGWEDGDKRAAAVGDLEQYGLVRSLPGGVLEATYQGLVWETRRHTLWQCDVFLSHATDDRPTALALKAFLLRAFGPDFRVFVSSDYRSIGGGELWFTKLLDALKAAPVVLVLLSEGSVGRRWINFEAGIGIGAGTLVIPVAVAPLKKIDVGHPLAELQTRALSDREDVDGVLADIQKRTGRAPAPVDTAAFATATHAPEDE